MEDKMNKLQGGIWLCFSVILAIALAVNGIIALMGKAQFAYWHLPTLAISLAMSFESLPAIKGLIIKTTKKAAKTIVVQFGAVRSLPALFQKRTV